MYTALYMDLELLDDCIYDNSYEICDETADSIIEQIENDKNFVEFCKNYTGE